MLWTAQNGGFGGFGTLQIVVRIYRVLEPILSTGAQKRCFRGVSGLFHVHIRVWTCGTPPETVVSGVSGTPQIVVRK